MVKRASDLLLSTIALIILSLPLLIITCIVRVKFGSPVFFCQVRPGLNGNPFMLIKFRTMSNAYGPNGEMLSDAERLTSFGRLLRSTSLDELPELWNVLRGDMSLVGPRPLLMEYIPLYSPKQFQRHNVRPGITGWAQINGRNALSWGEKFNLDIYYVENQSFWLDIKILLLTVTKVLAREGINADGEATMKKFEGDN